MLGNHILGLYEKAIPPELSWKERLSTAKELGFDYMEISIDETDERLDRLKWNKQERSVLKQAIEDTGVPVMSMCLSGHRRFPLGSHNPEIRKRALEIMEDAITFSVDIGIRVVQLAGYDVYYEDSTEESLKLFKENLLNACNMASKHQVMLAMEIMDTELMSTITRYKKYEKLMQSPWFNVYPDIGNLSAWQNDTYGELDLGIHEIVAIHLKDTLAVTKDFPGKFKCVPFGTGCVDFKKFFAHMEKLNYCGPFMIEMWQDPESDWKKDIIEARDFIFDQYENRKAGA